jgi:hypothetical protein
MKKAFATLFMGLALVSCSTPEPPPTPMQLDFSSMGKLYLTTEDVRVVNRAYSTPERPPYVGHLFEPRLADAINQWGVSRLQAVGRAGHATLIIKDASVMQQSLPTEGGMDSWFTRQQASKYIARVEVAFEAQNPEERTTGLASANAVHAATLPEEPTEAEKYATYKALVEAVIKDLNQAFTQSIKERMGRFLTTGTTPGATSSSAASAAYAPVAAAPLTQAPSAAAPAPVAMAPAPVATAVSSAPLAAPARQAAPMRQAPTPTATESETDIQQDPANPIIITSP